MRNLKQIVMELVAAQLNVKANPTSDAAPVIVYALNRELEEALACVATFSYSNDPGFVQ